MNRNARKSIQRYNLAITCRFCLSQTSACSIFEISYDNFSFQDLVSKLFATFVRVDDPLPNNVCEKCICDIIRFHDFTKKFKDSERILQQMTRYLGKPLQHKSPATTVIVKPPQRRKSDEILLKSVGTMTELSQALGRRKAPPLQLVPMITEAMPRRRVTKTPPFQILDVASLPPEKPTPAPPIDPLAITLPPPRPDHDPLALTRPHLDPLALTLPPPRPNLDPLALTLPPPHPNLDPLALTLPPPRPNLDPFYDEDANVEALCVKLENLIEVETKFAALEPQAKPLYECRFCLEPCESAYALGKHSREFHSAARRFKCEFCPKTFTKKGILTIHKRRHTGEKPYICPTCNKAFPCLSNLRNHKNIHGGEKRFLCHHCGMRFYTLFQERMHRRTHTGEKPHACDECHLKFAHSSSLKGHKLRTHTKNVEQKQNCPKCNKEFTSKYRFLDHWQTHRREKLLCNICGKSLCTLPALTIHMRVHTGEKPYACDTCGKKFRQKGGLKAHLVKHEKGIPQGPVKCPFCDKEFLRNNNLEVHVKEHTEEPLFKCEVCQKGFYWHGSFALHKKIHEWGS